MSCIRKCRSRHWLTVLMMLAVLGAFAFALVNGANHLGKKLAPSLVQLEQNGPDEN